MVHIINHLEDDQRFDDIEIVAYSSGAGNLVVAIHRAGVCACRITVAPHRPGHPDPPPEIITTEPAIRSRPQRNSS